MIRHTKPEDIDRIMEIYEYARLFMARNGNPNQWGATNWPPRKLILQDIADGKSYVCEADGKISATFFYDYGADIEPIYACIEDGAWTDPSPYGVIHRIASDGSVKGIGRYCIEWVLSQCGHLRIDTHGDNKVMQNLLNKMGFHYCGTVYVQEDNDPRMAYEKTEVMQTEK